MYSWPKHPVIYEINAWTWLGELSQAYGRRITLGDVPGAEWDALAAYRFDAVWLMGVWTRSPKGIAIAMDNPTLAEDFRRVLPDFRPEDVVGSPYCIRDYAVDPVLGGPEGLATARAEMRRRGMRLILDFVPNHVAPDHAWATEHPDYFTQGSAEDLASDPAAFMEVGGNVIARGRDPYFPPWPDVLQLNAFSPGLRKAATETLRDIARQSDGVRCDMAMLFLSPIFAKTWGERAGAAPATEYWHDLVGLVKREFPGFLFAAEAYWDLEWELQQQGFDYCYDKRLYDRLEHDSAESVRLHLTADPGYRDRLLRFIENHDEPRAATAFPGNKEFAAAVVVATVPGAKLYHQGQFEGRKIRLPVFLGRRPDEPDVLEIRDFYRHLLDALNADNLRLGEWALCERRGWPENPDSENIVSWCWHDAGRRLLVVVNLSDSVARARVLPPWDDMAGKTWTTVDLLAGETYTRSGDEIAYQGLYVELPAWGFHLLGRWEWEGSKA